MINISEMPVLVIQVENVKLMSNRDEKINVVEEFYCE